MWSRQQPQELWKIRETEIDFCAQPRSGFWSQIYTYMPTAIFFHDLKRLFPPLWSWKLRAKAVDFGIGMLCTACLFVLRVLHTGSLRRCSLNVQTKNCR